MHKSLIWMTLAGCLLAILPAQASADCIKPLTVGWESWKPFMYRNEKGRLSGLDIELIRAVAKRLGCPLRFVELPFKRHMLELENGRIDLATSVQFKPERERYAYYSTAYRDSRVGLALSARAAARYPVTNLAQLRQLPLKLGITRGYYYGPGVAALMRQPDKLLFEDAVSDQSNLTKMLAGRIDGFFVDPIVLAAMQPPPDEVELLPLPVYSTTYHFILSRRSAGTYLLREIDQALEQVKASGELQNILERYQAH